MRELLAEVERAAVRGWPALTALPVDGWLCRLTSGGSIRANSVAALDYSGTDLDASIAAVERFYEASRSPVVFTISEVSTPAGLDAALERRGYRRSGDHVTMGKAVPIPPAQLPPGVTISDHPDADWLPVYLSGLSADRRGIAPRILEGLPPGHFISARRDGRVAASGLTIPDGRLASVQCMATLPEARRRGAAGDVLTAIEHVASQAGAKSLYLQTDRENTAAIELYRRQGFEVIGLYHTRIKR